MAGAPDLGTHDQSGLRVCRSCGSWNTEVIENEYRTGVTAPDGGQEWRRVVGIHCKECGALEEI